MKQVLDIEKSVKLMNGTSSAKIYLNVNYHYLAGQVIGQPTLVGSPDDKVQLRWVFSHGKKVLTIYDYKARTSIFNINCWHVGSKNMTQKESYDFLRDLGFSDSDIILE